MTGNSTERGKPNAAQAPPMVLRGGKRKDVPIVSGNDWLDRVERVAEEQKLASEQRTQAAREADERLATRFAAFTQQFKDAFIPQLAPIRAALSRRGFDMQVFQLKSDGERLEQTLRVIGGTKTGSGTIRIEATRRDGPTVTLTAKRFADGSGEERQFPVPPERLTIELLKECLEVVMTSYMAGGLSKRVNEKGWGHSRKW